MSATVSQLPTKRPRKAADPMEALRADIRQLHDCVHSVGEKVEAVDGKVDGLTERVAKVEGFQAGIAARVGVPGEGEKAKPAIGFMGRGKAILTLTAAVFGAVTAAVTAYPFLVLIARALHEALLMSGAQ